jgi:FKBP-type peptidyl-prolyl cis-trans isomerase FklB
VLFAACVVAQKPTNVKKSNSQVSKPTSQNSPISIMNEQDSILYSIAVLAAADYAKSYKTFDNDVLIKAFNDALNGNTAIPLDQARKIYSDFRTKALRADGERFLAENAKKQGVTVLASGVQYEILKEGNGIKPTATDKVTTHYAGTLINGVEFDSSIKRGQPATFPVNGVIKGWQEILQLMPKGSKWKVFIPYHLAYGERGAGSSIPPYSALIFEIELLEIAGK